ncbi:MAG: UPF0147 family protein [Candidatus Altiarchaeota archaeon]
MQLKEVLEKIDEVINDHTMPKRVKSVLAKIKEDLQKNDGQDPAVRVTSAIYTIDEIVNDVNIPMHAKTTLWNIVSDLEALKNE